MSFKNLFSFLEELTQNNHKEWMDAHRSRYKEVRDFYIDWLNSLDVKLSQMDPDYSPTNGKQAINRINNNLLFHPDKPVYKDHFGAGLDKVNGKGDFYIHIGIHEIFVAGGFYRPKKKTLDSIRAAIDYNGEEFLEILKKPSFQNDFGSLIKDEKLKTTPKGYSKDHSYIELLRNKSFAVKHDFTRKEVVAGDFQKKVLKIYEEMLPFRNYLNKAVSV